MVRTQTTTRIRTKLDLTEAMRNATQTKAHQKENEKAKRKREREEKEEKERQDGQNAFKKLSKKSKRELKGMASHLGSLRKLELSMVINQASFLKKCKTRCII